MNILLFFFDGFSKMRWGLNGLLGVLYYKNKEKEKNKFSSLSMFPTQFSILWHVFGAYYLQQLSTHVSQEPANSYNQSCWSER